MSVAAIPQRTVFKIAAKFINGPVTRAPIATTNSGASRPLVFETLKAPDNLGQGLLSLNVPGTIRRKNLVDGSEF
jgi:hypothetical protein